jgi:hypothetical protein
MILDEMLKTVTITFSINPLDRKSLSQNFYLITSIEQEHLYFVVQETLI